MPDHKSNANEECWKVRSIPQIPGDDGHTEHSMNDDGHGTAKEVEKRCNGVSSATTNPTRS